MTEPGDGPPLEQTRAASVVPGLTFDEIAERTPAVLYVDRADLTPVYISPQIEKLLGVTAEDFVELDLFESMVHPDDRADATAVNWEAVRAGGMYQEEYRMIARDGSVVWVRDEASVHLDPSGEPVLFFGFLTDITEQKKNEEEMKRSLSLLRATLESTADGILVVDEERRVVDFNDTFVKLWQLPRELVESRDDEALLTHVCSQLKDPDDFLRGVEALYENEHSSSSDVLEFADGRIYERYSQPQLLGDEVVGRVWSFRDVTLKQQMQNQLLETQKLQAIARLAGGVAHDFNNLLQVIIVCAEMVEEGVDDEQALTDLHSIKSAAERGAGLVQQLLAFAREQTTVPRGLELQEHFEQIRPLISSALGEAIELRFDVAESCPPVFVDGEHLERVFLNLAVNTREAMDEGYFAVSAEPKDADTVRITVRDNGPGMEPEIAQRAFEPFFTTHGRATRSGLGLSTVVGLIEQAGGRVSMETAPGEGVALAIELPVAREEEAHDPPI